MSFPSPGCVRGVRQITTHISRSLCVQASCSGFSGFSTVESPRTTVLPTNPARPRSAANSVGSTLSRKQLIGIGAGGKNPGPGGHRAGP